MRIGEAEGLHRSVPQSLDAALGHDLDRQAAVEIGRVLEGFELDLLARDQAGDEVLILRF